MDIIVPKEVIESRIYLIRGSKVMLDRGLAELYQVETRTLNQSVKRNISRFPEDFMFQLTDKEFSNLKSQFVISSWGGARTLPFVFTEHGVAMLSSVLRSERAVQINIQIMRAFTKLREMMKSHKELLDKVNELEKRYDYNFQIVFEAIDQLLAVPDKNVMKIGFI